MENSNPILNELKEISPLVAAIGKQSSYLVPEGYFDNLAIQVMLRIAIEEKAGADPVLNINKDNVYQAPAGYFDNFAAGMLNRIKAAETGNATEELELLSPLLGRIAKKNPFSAPEGYFTDISENIVSGVKAIDFVNEELENLSPVMISLKNKTLYEVPAGYFDTVPEIILQKAKEQQPARIVSFGKRIIQYAAAAVVTGIVLFSGYKYAGKKDIPATDNIAAATAQIPDQEIENFLSNNTVSLADISTEADTTDALSKDPTSTSTTIDDTKDLLANISDEELQKYVDQHSETPITN